MLKNRRIGTLSAGVCLIVFGVLFLLHVFHAISYTLILSLWPVILVALGVEMILSYIINKENTIHYDGWGVFLMICMLFFAGGMAIAEIILVRLPQFIQNIR